jgi:hypothetical protein
MHRYLALVVVLTVCAGFLACGGDSPATPTAVPQPAPAPTPPPGPPSPPRVTVAGIAVDSSVLSGQTAQGTVRLSDAAPDGGLAVSLSADNAAARVPASLTIPAGATSAAFAVTTARVMKTTNVTITAQTGDVTRTTSIRLRIDPASVMPTATFSITFADLFVHEQPVSVYNEQGFNVSEISAAWTARTSYGNPAPYLGFDTVPGVTTTGEIRITSGGSPFLLNSVDLYSSVTPIPYVIEGFLSEEPMFTVVNTLGNTFGNFVRVANPRATVPVDVLVIRLSNPATCCRNPMGIDNVAIRR